MLHDYEALKAEHDAVYAVYRAEGPYPALERFANLTQANQKNLRNIINFEFPYMFSNMMYWFEREFLDYPMTKFDVEGEFGGLKEKLVLVCGEETKKTPYQYRGNEKLGEVLALEVRMFPGEHVAHMTHAKDSAKRLKEILKAKDADFYDKL